MIDLRCGDALDVLRTLAADSVDAVVTDPPYGVGKAAWDVAFPTEWIEHAWRVAPRMLVMCGNKSLPQAIQAIGNYRDCLVMHATNGMTRSPIAFGKWFPCVAFGKWKWRPQANVIQFAVRTNEVEGHPSPKPLEAMVKLVERFTDPGWTILDPFAGSGTTAIACIRTGRKFIGCEIDPAYHAIAQRRIAAEQARHPLLEAATP
jgi:DNA modification methylase